MYPIIADIITRFQEKNYRDGREIDERYARIFNKKFNLDGKYYVGDLEFNNTLSTHVVLDTNAFRYSSLEESRYLYPTGNNKLILDSLPIYKIVNRYVEQELDASLADNINKQNNVVSNVMTLLTRLTPGGSNSEIDYSEYYWDLFKYLDRYPIKNYFLNERAIESNSAKKELEDVRDSLSKLQDLTKEETELLSRLA